jgi:hypothetical protein
LGRFGSSRFGSSIDFISQGDAPQASAGDASDFLIRAIGFRFARSMPNVAQDAPSPCETDHKAARSAVEIFLSDGFRFVRFMLRRSFINETPRRCRS